MRLSEASSLQEEQKVISAKQKRAVTSDYGCYRSYSVSSDRLSAVELIFVMILYIPYSATHCFSFALQVVRIRSVMLVEEHGQFPIR